MCVSESTGVCEHVRVWCRLCACAVLTRFENPSRAGVWREAEAPQFLHQSLIMEIDLLFWQLSSSLIDP